MDRDRGGLAALPLPHHHAYESRTRRFACLWYGQGKTTEARGLLAPVYGWITEGFDTADLKDAKALLEQLS